MEERAYAPHCDSNILHAPQSCIHCDHYPDWQEARIAAGMNFTGEHDTNKIPCPAEQLRDLDTINLWYGNVPRPYRT